MTPLLSLCDARQQILADPRAAKLLVERCLETIQRREPDIQAWVVVDEAGARRAAAQARAAVAAGQESPPLLGIPIGIKDIFEVAGLPTRAGSAVRAGEGFVAADDAPVVARLRQAGAILLGKTTTAEFAFFDPPSTRNPWNLQHTPGGSSSGSAAAVAAGMCLAAIGTQTGGSLIRPASYCGVAAIKPTFGTVPREGVIPAAYHLDHPGLMARRVEDLGPILRVISDLPDPGVGELTAPPRLGLLQEHFLEEVAPSMRRCLVLALGRLRAGGAAMAPVALPDSYTSVHVMHRRIMAAEMAAYHRPQFAARRDGYGSKLRQFLDEALELPAVDYAEALAAQRQFRRELLATLADVDALIMPATNTTAPASLETTGDSKFQVPWSLAGVPAVTLPCGLATDGMPVALQLVGPAGSDYQLLRIAEWCERQLAFDALPPVIG